MEQGASFRSQISSFGTVGTCGEAPEGLVSLSTLGRIVGHAALTKVHVAFFQLLVL